MAKFIVNQNVLCEVNVNYRIEANSKEEAQRIVNDIKTPTCFDCADYEIVSDERILSTDIKGV